MSLPKHLAIIMDGNGRWAKLRHRPRSLGHIKGARVAKKMITECSNLGIKYLTLYAFSTENWLRPEMEVSLLMKLLKRYLIKETESLVKNNIKFNTIGNLNKLPIEVQSAIKHTVEKTKNCTGMNLIFAINYGSKQEIINSVKKLTQNVLAKKIDLENITEEEFENSLETSTFPHPDLLIRTSGEKRISNFLLWQLAYTEFYFTDQLWPDFNKLSLDKALAEYGLRNRRFGGINYDEVLPR